MIDPIPPSHPARSKGIFPHESGKQGSHMERQMEGSGCLMNIPIIQFCALVKCKAQHYTSWAFTTTCWNLKCWDQKCQGFAVSVHQQTCLAHIWTVLICSFSRYFLSTYWGIIARPKFKFMALWGHGNSLSLSLVELDLTSGNGEID